MVKKVIMINTKTRTIRVENADKNIDWITVKGTHVPIEKGQSKSSAVKSFVESKRGESGDSVSDRSSKVAKYWKKQSAEQGGRGILKQMERDTKELARDISKATKDGSDLQPLIDRVERNLKWYKKTNKEFEGRGMTGIMVRDLEEMLSGLKKQQPAKPSKKADVSDIVKSYKEKMAAAGPRASIRKTDRIEADAIKEFMTRKLGANRPYDDYYNYWLSGMDKATKDAFNEIYNESEAREMAFSELASDVDHSGMARGEPTYDELEQWSEKQKAKKAQQQPAKKEPERDWQRGDDEDEDAYFDRREKTMAEARKLDKVSDWYGKAYKGDSFGKPKNKDLTFDELADGLLSGKITDFYEAVGTGESDVREKIFQELSERTGRPYDDFYDAWLHGGSKGTESRRKKQAESAAWMDKLLELHTDMDPDLRKAIVAARDRAKKDS